MGLAEFVDTKKEAIDKRSQRRECAQNATAIAKQIMSVPGMVEIGRSFTEKSDDAHQTSFECLETPFVDFEDKEIAIRQLIHPIDEIGVDSFQLVVKIDNSISEVYATVDVNRMPKLIDFIPIQYSTKDVCFEDADQEVVRAFSAVATAMNERMGALVQPGAV